MYISFDQTDPGTLYGGTWERLKKVFLFAADDDQYTVGNSGGEETTTLTVDEMPSHNHGVRVRVQGYDGWETYTSNNYGVMFQANDTVGYHGPNYTAHSAEVTNDTTTIDSGGSQPHNNMPPYVTAYMWKRVA